MIRNYFADLELPIDADAEEIRHAFKRLARRFHPDLNPLDLHAEESFKRINEAFEYLSSLERAGRLRRRLQNQSVNLAPKKWEFSSKVPQTTQQFLRDWIEEPTRKTQKTGKTSTKKSARRRIEDLDIRVSISASQSQLSRGLEASMVLDIDTPCPQCRSRGLRSSSIAETCKKCSGLGFWSIERGAIHWKKTCDDCRGRGFLNRSRCQNCQGFGKVKVKQNIRVHLHRSWNWEKPVIFQNLGHYSFDGKRRGNLWVFVQVKE